MFHLNRLFQWSLAAFLAALILAAIPFSQRDVALHRLDPELSRATTLQKNITSQCRELLTNDNNPVERWLVGKLSPSGQSPNPNLLPTCVLRAQTSSISRLGIYAQWNIGFDLFTNDPSRPILSEFFSTSFPLPLCFLPLLLFIFLLRFTLSSALTLVLLFLHLLFLNGLNLIPLIKASTQLSLRIITTDRLFPGLILFSLWLALRPLGERRKARPASSSLENLVNSTFSNLLGIWNPLLHTLLSPITFFPGKDLGKLKLFFNSQLLILAMSLYIFGLELGNIYSVLQTLLTPRYLSFSIFFCFARFLIPSSPNNIPLVWELPDFKKYLIGIVIIEGLGILVPELRSIPTLTRISLVLLLIDFSKFNLDSWSSIFQRWRKPFWAMLISSVVAITTSELGAIDLVIAICNPSKHPTAVLPFTLLSGFFLGFLTGGLSSPFFILVSQLIQAYPSPLIRAALFDGVLAGLMLSPFSLFNLFPAFQNEIPLQKILLLRFDQLIIPILMGLTIYFVATVTTLGILPPVCFVFACLIVLTYKLKKSRWQISNFGAIEHNDPHSV